MSASRGRTRRTSVREGSSAVCDLRFCRRRRALLTLVGLVRPHEAAIFFGVHDPAPHGGFLVLPVVDGWYLWLLAIFAGVLVGGILYVIFKRSEYHKNGDKVVE